ncbi:hypothetical protein B566_EDAN008710 [Ephemera danica]|nr:hypothetical protein B566_EDAN008710 [Ephemera danica]
MSQQHFISIAIFTWLFSDVPGFIAELEDYLINGQSFTSEEQKAGVQHVVREEVISPTVKETKKISRNCNNKYGKTYGKELMNKKKSPSCNANTQEQSEESESDKEKMEIFCHFLDVPVFLAELEDYLIKAENKCITPQELLQQASCSAVHHMTQDEVSSDIPTVKQTKRKSTISSDVNKSGKTLKSSKKPKRHVKKKTEKSSDTEEQSGGDGDDNVPEFLAELQQYLIKTEDDEESSSHSEAGRTQDDVPAMTRTKQAPENSNSSRNKQGEPSKNCKEPCKKKKSKNTQEQSEESESEEDTGSDSDYEPSHRKKSGNSKRSQSKESPSKDSYLLFEMPGEGRNRFPKNQLGNPYKCGVCGSVFHARKNVRQHMIRMHSGRLPERPPCAICNKIFSCSSMLSRHRTKMHLPNFDAVS